MVDLKCSRCKRIVHDCGENAKSVMCGDCVNKYINQNEKRRYKMEKTTVEKKTKKKVKKAVKKKAVKK